MGKSVFTFGVFSKPWPEKNLEQLGEFLSGMGFDGVEYPVRGGYSVSPDNVEDLPKAKNVLAGFGVNIDSIAGPTDERTIAACGEAGVPIIRICGPGLGDGFRATIDKMKKEFEALIPLLCKHGVAIGVQNHYGSIIGNGATLLHLLEDFDPRHVCAVWDPGHSSLVGQKPEYELSMILSHLRMVNLKNPYKFRSNSPAAPVAEWDFHWTAGCQGMAPWPEVARLLKECGWSGPVCLTAEYSDGECVDRLIAKDIVFAKSLFLGEGACSDCCSN